MRRKKNFITLNLWLVNSLKHIRFTIFSGIVLLIASGISSSYAQVPDFAGTWNTVTGTGKKMVITMATVRRTNVTGTYPINGLTTASYEPRESSINVFVKVSAIRAEPLPQNLSSIRGTLTDNVLRFKWFEEGSHGAGRFTMSPDGESFEGTFSLTDNPDDTSGGTWNGTRAPNFAGAWNASFGNGSMLLIFQQVGPLVTGQLKVNSADLGMTRGGSIDGNTLRFQVVRRDVMPGRPDQYVGIGELVMDKGSKSFKGTILGTATSGTRIGR